MGPASYVLAQMQSASRVPSQNQSVSRVPSQTQPTSRVSSQVNNAPPTKKEVFPCTFPNCKAVFEEEYMMIRHKIEAPEHDYCRRCKEDFENNDLHTLHKLTSIKHIVCPACYEEFKSTGGRDLHMRKAHKTEQKLVCVGCNEKFIRAGALLGHIEKGLCRNIKASEFEEQRVKKEIMRAVMKDEYEDRVERVELNAIDQPDTETGGVEIVSTIGFESQGGMILPSSGGAPSNRLIDMDSNTPAQSTHGRFISAKIDQESAVVAGNIKAPDEYFPMLPNQVSNAKQNTMQSITSTAKAGEVDLLTDDLQSASIDDGPAWTGHSGTALFPQAKKEAIQAWNEGVETESVPGGPEKFPPVLSNYEDPREEKAQWRPYEYLNSITGQFECPHKSCGRAYKTGKEFEAHLLSPAHTGGTIRCPSCLRIFKTATALMQHCEMSTQRCKIGMSANFRQIVDQISGGLLEAKGRHADGTVQFHAPEKQFW